MVLTGLPILLLIAESYGNGRGLPPVEGAAAPRGETITAHARGWYEGPEAEPESSVSESGTCS